VRLSATSKGKTAPENVEFPKAAGGAEGAKIPPCHFARTDDRVRLYYEEHGRGGTPLVLAYGIGGTRRHVGREPRRARPAHHRLVLWEPRGHARSDSPEDPARYSFQRWALDLKTVLDHLRIRRAHVGGLSLGAGIATRSRSGFRRGSGRSWVTNCVLGRVACRLSVEELVMRARLDRDHADDRGWTPWTRFAMAANPNLSERLAIEPAAREEFYAEYRQRLTQ